MLFLEEFRVVFSLIFFPPTDKFHDVREQGMVFTFFFSYC